MEQAALALTILDQLMCDFRSGEIERAELLVRTTVRNELVAHVTIAVAVVALSSAQSSLKLLGKALKAQCPDGMDAEKFAVAAIRESV